MLGSHPNLAVPNESHLYSQIYPVVQQHKRLGHAATRPRLVAEILKTDYIGKWTPAPSLSGTLETITEDDFHGIVDGLLRAWAYKQGKSRWGEKTPAHTLCWRSILAGFPGVQIIHLVRDGRDVALSYRSAAFGPKHVYPLALRWQQYLAAAESARESLSDDAFLQVHYEDLVSAPERELRRLCVFLGEEFSPAMLAYHQTTETWHVDSRNARNLRTAPMLDNIGKWRTRMTKRELRIFESLAGPDLERYGYDRILATPRISRLEALSCRYLEHPPKRLSAMLRNRQTPRRILQNLRLHFCLMK